MSAETIQCPKCNGEMEQGFTFESEGPKRMVSTWVEGAPEKSWWQSAKVLADKCIPVGTFRCSECGFLESMRGRNSLPNNPGESDAALGCQPRQLHTKTIVLP